MTINLVMWRHYFSFQIKSEMKSLKHILFFIICAVVVACAEPAHKKVDDINKYVPASKELFAEIVHMDSVMFDAFNAHDLDKLMSTFDSSLEFYHDQGGVTNYEQNKMNFINSFERNKTTGLRRDLVPGSMEVYPIKDYGAIETGLHRFCHEENGKQDCGTFKFLHIWQHKNGQWKVTRVASYDHK
jgi:hypothetical protein